MGVVAQRRARRQQPNGGGMPANTGEKAIRVASPIST
jgi:hypothetical protein